MTFLSDQSDRLAGSYMHPYVGYPTERAQQED